MLRLKVKWGKIVKTKDHNYILAISIFVFIFGSSLLGFCEEHERITFENNGQTKRYDVIETKRYEIVEVEESVVSPDRLESVAEQAVKDAEKDAKYHLNPTLWFSTGCFLSFVGPVLSQRYQPFMPTGRVLGKSPQYVAFYYDAYKVKTKKLQFNWALGGCLIGTPIGGYLISVIYSARRN